MAEEHDIAAALPDYEVGGELGRGGFGLVRAGRHRHLKREVAIKELPPSLASDAKVRARFAAEARVLASLSHPHIVPIYDYVEREGLCLLVMEHLPRGTVWKRFKEQGFGPQTACAVAVAACAGLHYAHERGVLHRDVKPENLLYSAEDVIKITDFGIAKVVGGSETLATRGGEILGTPAYMAPEQATGGELGAPADVYATGVMLYELLSGHLPYAEGDPLAVVYRHVYEDAIPLRDVAPEVPPDLAAVTMRALARSTEDRYATAEEFGAAIEAAAASAWGPAWEEQADLPIFRPQPTNPPPARPPSPGSPARTGQPSTVIVPRPQASRPADGPGPAPAPPDGNKTGVGRPPSRVAPRVRPKAEEHVAGAANIEMGGAELVPIRQVIELPAPPYVQASAALVLLLLAVAVSFIGLGGHAKARALGPGVATVAGIDPARPGTIELDLTKPIEIRLRQLPPNAANANAVQLGFSAAGAPLPPSTTEDLTPTDNGMVASVDAKGVRYLVAGTVTAELRLLAGDQPVLKHEFSTRSTQSSFLTIPGVLVVALLLFVLAYVESLLRPLRRGRRQVSGIAGMVLLGAVLGAVIVPLVWLLGGPEPSMSTAVVCIILGVGAAVAAALAAIQIGRRARIKPKKQVEAERAVAA